MEGFFEDSRDGGQGQTSLLTNARRSSLDKCYEDVLMQENDVKLQETPIVYTTKLDDMDIFNQISDHFDMNVVTNRILRESKPCMKNKCLLYSYTDKTSYDRVVKKLNELNEKSRCNKRCVPQTQEIQIGNESNNLREKLHTLNNNEYNLTVNSVSKNMNSKIDTTGIDELFNERPVIDHNKSNDTNTLFIETKTDEDEDIQLLNYNAISARTSTLDIDTNSKSVKKNNKRKRERHGEIYGNKLCNTTTTVDTDSDEEDSLAIIKYKKTKHEQCKHLKIVLEDIGIRRRKLRVKPFAGPGFLYCGKWFKINEMLTLKLKIKNVYLFFHDKCTQIIDIYIIENRSMIEHKKVNFNKSSVILKNSFNLKETIEIECYCWYERVEASLKALESGILLAYHVTFMKQRHSCEQSTCVCCCSTRNNKEKKITAVGDYEISQEDLEIKQMEEQISQEISTIQTKDICYSILKHYNWNDILKMENSTPTLINKCLRYNRNLKDNCDELQLPLNTNNFSNNNESIKLLQTKSLCVTNNQDSEKDRDSNTQPHLLTPRTCEERKKIRLSMKLKPLLTPDRGIKRVAKFQIERLDHEFFPGKRTPINRPNTVVAPDRLCQKKTGPLNEYATSAKVQPKNKEKRNINKNNVCWSKDNEGLEKTFNIQNVEHTDSQKVKNIGKLIDSLVNQFLGNVAFVKTPTQDQNAGTTTAIQRNKKNNTSESNVNPTDSFETDKLSPDSLITSILKRFEGIRLTINETRIVSASLNMPINTLSTMELKVLSSIISQAQHQVDTLALLPGSYWANVNLKENTSDETTKLQLSSSHQTTIIQDSKAQQQKIFEEDLLPETNILNFISTDNSSVEAIPLSNKDSNMLKTKANSLSASGINDVDADSYVYKMFSRILKKKNDSYKKYFMVVNPYLIPENSPPLIKIDKVYSLAADAATENIKTPSDFNANKIQSTVKVTDYISARRNTELKTKFDNQTANLNPTASSSKSLISLPNMRVSNYELILNEFIKSRRIKPIDSEHSTRVKKGS